MRTTHRRHIVPIRSLVLAAAIAGAFAPAAMAATFTVTNGNSSGAGSLAQAINDANASCGGGDVIDIVGGPFTISPGLPLPTITCGVTIQGNASILDGSFMYGGGCALPGTVPFAVENMVVRNHQAFTSPVSVGICGPVKARGLTVHNNAIGIQIQGGHGEIGGAPAGRNYFYFNQRGVYVAPGGDALISHNYIGTVTGSDRRGNEVGIELGGGGSTVEQNLISGNDNLEGTGIGVWVGTSGSTIRDNLIGTDASGLGGLSNVTGIVVYASVTISGNTIAASNVGINVNAGSTITGNKVGTNKNGDGALGNAYGIQVNSGGSGSSISGRNVISGNTDGIYLGSGVNAAVIDGNLIGTSASGSGAIANMRGLSVTCGGGVAITNNTISGNDEFGLGFASVKDSRVEGNKIGVAEDGMTSRGNAGYGALIKAPGCVLVDGPPPPPFEGGNLFKTNVIAYNGKPGIAVLSGNGNEFRSNFIHGNGFKQIDLLNDPIEPTKARSNDVGDTDPGPNNGQNYPDIVSAVKNISDTTITFTLEGVVGSSHVIEPFSNPSPMRAGSTPAGPTMTVTLASSPQTFAMTLPGISQDHFTLTATGNGGQGAETSEFSDVKSAVATPAVSISPTFVDFGEVAVGGSSAPRTVTLSSIGSAPWIPGTFTNGTCTSGVTMCQGSAFICSTTCKPGTSYASGMSCAVTATFAPIAAGLDQATRITVCDNAGSAQMIDLVGDGVVPPPIRVEPARFDFGRVIVGRASGTQRFEVVNPSASPVSIGPVSVEGPFELVSTNCGRSVPARSSCVADARFAPKQPGEVFGSLYVPVGGATPAASASYGPKVAPSGSAISVISGTGIDQAQIETPALVDFGAYTLGASPVVRPVIVRNTGNAVVTMDSIRVTGPFTLSHDCPFNFGPDATCTLTVAFSDTTIGEKTGEILIVSSASGGIRAIALKGLVQRQPLPLITVNPQSISFGNRLIGTQSVAQRVTVSNDGGATATLGAFSASLDFVIVNTSCGPSLAQGESCFADVAMRPLGFGTRAGELSFTSNAAGSPHRVDLLGLGCRPFSLGNNRGGGGSSCSP